MTDISLARMRIDQSADLQYLESMSGKKKQRVISILKKLKPLYELLGGKPPSFILSEPFDSPCSLRASAVSSAERFDPLIDFRPQGAEFESKDQNQPLGINFETPFQLVVGTILSAQCTDERVNQVTQTFFDRLRTPADYLRLTQQQLEKLIRPTGFFRNKAKHILGAAQQIEMQFNGQIPATMQALLTLPGFGRKTANVILSRLHHVNEGVCVDTHVLRLSQRLELTKNKNPVQDHRYVPQSKSKMILRPRRRKSNQANLCPKPTGRGIEKDLMNSTPQNEWETLSHCLILHGRQVCTARNPKCEKCVLKKMCSIGKKACSQPCPR